MLAGSFFSLNLATRTHTPTLFIAIRSRLAALADGVMRAPSSPLGAVIYIRVLLASRSFLLHRQLRGAPAEILEILCRPLWLIRNARNTLPFVDNRNQIDSDVSKLII